MGNSPLPLVRKVDLHRPSLTSRVIGIPIPRPKKKVKAIIAIATSAPTSGPPPLVETAFIVASSEEAREMPLPTAPIPVTA